MLGRLRPDACRGLARCLSGLLLLASMAACSGPPGVGTGKLPVVTTVTQVSALVRAVGGDRIDLTTLVSSRDDPHQYEIRPQQVPRLQAARAIFISGVGLDRWMEPGVRSAGGRARVVDLSQGLKLREATGGEGGGDPHWWYDVDNAKQAASMIAQALTELDGAGRQAYERNAAALRQRLEQADVAIHGAIDPIPAARRLFVANHDSFNYFLARYDITLIGDIVPSTDSIAAVRPADVSRLVREIRLRHVCAVFSETTIDPKLARQIAGEAGVRVFDGKLYGDAIDEPGRPGGTLEGALTHNGKLMADAFRSC